MQRYAFLVLAHRAPKVVARLVARLVQDGDVFLHVDAKADIEVFRQAIAVQNAGPGIVRFASCRHMIRWGGFTMVDATLGLLRDALESRYDRVTLLSGDSYPISENRLRAMLASKQDHITVLDSRNDSRRRRIERVYLPDTDIGQTMGAYDDRCLNVDDIVEINRAASMIAGRQEFLERTGYYMGSQWWSLTIESLKNVLQFCSDNPDFEKNMRYSLIPDEAFFQTAFISAKGKSAVHEPGPVFTKWDSNPRPYEFVTIDDFKYFDSVSAPFARKFNEKSHALLDILDKQPGVGATSLNQVTRP